MAIPRIIWAQHLYDASKPDSDREKDQFRDAIIGFKDKLRSENAQDSVVFLIFKVGNDPGAVRYLAGLSRDRELSGLLYQAGQALGDMQRQLEGVVNNRNPGTKDKNAPERDNKSKEYKKAVGLTSGTKSPQVDGLGHALPRVRNFTDLQPRPPAL